MKRHRTRRRRGTRRNTADRASVVAGVVICAVCLAAFVGFGYWKLTAKSPPELVAKTLCPVAGATSVTVVLIDSSDSIPEIGRRELEIYLTDIADDVPEYGLLELRLLNPEQHGGRTVFSRCNPGDGSNLSSLTANPDYARQRWAEGFREPLRIALESGLAPTGSATSPILATIQAIAVERFNGKATRDIPKQLIVVSDMIEHGPAYSQYQPDLSYERFTRSPAHLRFQTSLGNAGVTIRYIDRPAAGIDTIGHIAFWTTWIHDNNGDLKSVERVQGAG